MGSKSFGLFALGIFALVLVMGLASAVTLSNWTLTTNAAPTNVAANLNAGNLTAGAGVSGLTFDATNGATGTGWNQGAVGATDYYQVTLTAASGFNFTISSVSFNQVSSNSTTNMNFDVNWSKDNFATSTSLVSAGVSTTTSALSSTNTNMALNSGETLTLRIFGYNSDNSSTETFSVRNLNIQGTPIADLTDTAICAFDSGVTANPDYLKVDIRSIDVTEGFGEDEDWLPFDEVEVEVRVKNNGLNNYDIDDISLEWGIAPDNLNSDWVVDFDEIDEFNLKDDDESTFTITFRVDEDDLDMNIDEFMGNDWNLVVRATGAIDDEDNLLSVDDTCAADFEPVSIDEDNAVILTNFNIPETLQCGQTYTITADAWNIGDSQEDEVKVDVYDRNREFIDELFEVGDIDEFDNTEFSFDLQIPRDAEEKTYSLVLRVLDEDRDVYEVGKDDDEVEYFVPLIVSGGCSTASQVTVTANTVSGGRAGQELVVKATVTNTGDSQAAYTLSVSGSESWASSYSLDQSSLVLNAGESKDVTVTLDVNRDAAGSQTFYLEMASGTDVVRQPVAVTIEPSSGFLGITGNTIAENPVALGLGVLVLVLIIAIVVVVVRRR